MLQIPPEFILQTLENAYKKYDEYDMLIDEAKTLKIYGFCDGLEKLVKKFAPEYIEEVNIMKSQSRISNMKTTPNEIDLDKPTYLRQSNYHK